MREQPDAREIAAYVHWPFCKAKCPYCDFNSHVRHHPLDAISFAGHLVSELESFLPLTAGCRVGSVFFGGGTPSLMPPEAVALILDTIDRCWGFSGDVEISLEANPTSAEAGNFVGYRTAGVNRLSVGVQSLDDAQLRALGRQHSAKEALAAFRLAATIFPRVSFDLIYALPNQSEAQWRDELSAALADQQGHMSLYQLTIEEGTRYHDLYMAGALAMPDEDTAASLFEITQELTERAGLRAYEVSNHAAPGHESKHNLTYWRCGDYLGVGPGAHSRIELADGARLAAAAELHPEVWRDLVSKKGHGRKETSRLSPGDQGLELLLMGLRLTEGVSLRRYHQLTGAPLDERKIAELAEQGLVVHDAASARLAATAKGRRVLNTLTAALALQN